MEIPVDPPPAIVPLTEQAQRAVRGILEDSYLPAIFILGATPRSGTVYTGELVRLHPDVAAHPNQLWEVPFLRGIGPLLKHQVDFVQTYGRIVAGWVTTTWWACTRLRCQPICNLSFLRVDACWQRTPPRQSVLFAGTVSI
jgi:hypothetical protein